MIEIIPAIDIIDGKCVRLSQGDYRQKREYGDPLDMALKFEDHGLNRLHLVDLDGAREKHVVNHRVLEQIASKTGLLIDAGGGLRSDEDVRIVFESGARMITGGSVAVKDRLLFLGWLEKYGPGKIILGADFKEGKIAVSGWEEDTSVGLMDFLADFRKEGVEKAICTDILLDGMLEGPSLQTYRKIKEGMGSLHLIASGGISKMEDIEKLDEAAVEGVILGKAIYENRIPLKALENYILKKG
ncbi:MAG: 1-(5-phosphoribosyl)-5-[(5-phosphoribosylamino)methylideneamino]imidazole-4-carboxamide isomerase [Bacteroidales bacterium]|nr:1-(5-phosphoribosyl)-5-[(5-phosphoribosylamino)methylideneamino]imidazole-4-carboxamide isomerase [Bacteroidales bacterium]